MDEDFFIFHVQKTKTSNFSKIQFHAQLSRVDIF